MVALRPQSAHGIQLPQVLNCLAEPAIIVSTNRRIVAANFAYRDLIGAGKEVCGHRCYEVSHHGSAPCEKAGQNCPVRLCQETGEPRRVLHVHYTPQGEEYEEVTTFPIPDERGNVGSFLEILRPARMATAQPSESRLVGRSQAFTEMLSLIARVAPTNTTALLLGESGTGKDLVAQAIHQMSSRGADRSFVPLDCSGLSESLFESELFGHEKGAFTGATARKLGLVEAAHGGTLFLDEVGDIPLTLQVKLLRLLETGFFRRVGSTELRRADFRLICATHQDLKQMVKEGSFRQDLYYRIGVFPIVVPPLRQRLDDLPLLIESLRRRLGDGLSSIHPDTMTALVSYAFPGNIRELLNILERAQLLSRDGVMRPEHLPEEVRLGATESNPPPLTEGIVPLAEVETRYLHWAAANFRGQKRLLASKLGLSERSLYRKLRSVHSIPR